jgi:hypothetical protein
MSPAGPANQKVKAEYLKLADELDAALAELEKAKAGVNSLDKKVEDLEKALG